MFLQLILILVVLIPLLAIVLDSSVGRALASRLELRSLDGPSDLMAERITFLESEMERLTSEMETSLRCLTKREIRRGIRSSAWTGMQAILRCPDWIAPTPCIV